MTSFTSVIFLTYYNAQSIYKLLRYYCIYNKISDFRY